MKQRNCFKTLLLLLLAALMIAVTTPNALLGPVSAHAEEGRQAAGDRPFC